MTKHPHPEIFAARLDDLIDLRRGQLAHDLALANERGTLLDEVNLQLRTRESGPELTILQDLLDDLDGDVAAEAQADLAGAL